LTEVNSQTNEPTQRPVRIVMNNQTIAIYADEDYQNKIHIFNIRQSTILKGGFCCVQFLDKVSKSKVCGFQADCGTRVNNKWANDWVRDFNSFKNECSTRRSVSHLSRAGAKTALGKPLNPEDEIGELFDGAGGQTSSEIQRQTVAFQAKVNKKIENKINSKREEAILNTVRKSERQRASLSLAVTQNHGFKALEKENEIENLIEHEEQDREVKQFRKLARVIKKEKAKKNCLSKALKKKRN